MNNMNGYPTKGSAHYMKEKVAGYNCVTEQTKQDVIII